MTTSLVTRQPGDAGARGAAAHAQEGAVQVRDLMTADPITTRAEASVLEARQLMMDKRIRHLLITEGSKLLGAAIRAEEEP